MAVTIQAQRYIPLDALPGLQAAVAAILGNKLAGITTAPGGTSLHNGQPVQKTDLTIVRCHEEVTPAEDNDVRQAVLAYDTNIRTNGQLADQATEITRAQVVTYLKAQLTNATPDTPATIKATVQGYIESHARLLNALNNIATLYGHNLGTNVGYIRAVFDVMAVLK